MTNKHTYDHEIVGVVDDASARPLTRHNDADLSTLQRAAAFCALAATLLLTAAACGGRSSLAPPSVQIVPVTERDFAIRAPHHARAGEVRFVVTNNGPVSHELIVVRTRGRLPLRADGITVNEEALAPQIAGQLTPAGPGSRRTLDLRLTAGRYVLFCNMAGHYLSGMSSTLLVR